MPHRRLVTYVHKIIFSNENSYLIVFSLKKDVEKHKKNNKRFKFPFLQTDLISEGRALDSFQ